MDGHEEFMDPEILWECTCVHLPGFTVFHRPQRVLSPPKCIHKKHPALYPKLFFFLALTALKSQLNVLDIVEYPL